MRGKAGAPGGRDLRCEFGTAFLASLPASGVTVVCTGCSLRLPSRLRPEQQSQASWRFLPGQ